MSGPYISQHTSGDAGQKTKTLISWHGQGQGQARCERDRQPQQYRRPQHPSAGCVRRHEDRRQRNADRHLMDEDTEANESGGNGGRVGTNAQNETIGKVVDREPQGERPELMLVDAFLGRVTP